jgi:hypothetical protein
MLRSLHAHSYSCPESIHELISKDNCILKGATTNNGALTPKRLPEDLRHQLTGKSHFVNVKIR